MSKVLRNTLRTAFTYLPRTGLKKAPVNNAGLSFVIPVKDEENWIESSIASVADVADEIIVIDSSIEDSTTEIVASMAKDNNKIKHIRFYCPGPHAFALALHIGLVNVRYRWVFKWDSDMVAKSTEALMIWKARLNALNQMSYYVIDLPRINLEGDLMHQSKKCPFGCVDARIFTWSPELKWTLKRNYWEQVMGDSIWGHRFPPWYRTLIWNEPYIFHCNIKSPERVLMRKFWGDYMINKDDKFPNLREYSEYRVKEDWKMTMEEALQITHDEIMKDLIPYDKAKFGSLPKILLPNKRQKKKEIGAYIPDLLVETPNLRYKDQQGHIVQLRV